MELMALNFLTRSWITRGFPGGSDGKESACDSGDPSSIPGSRRSHREGNGNPLQDSFQENPMDRGAWVATVHRVAKSWTRLKLLGICIYKYLFSEVGFPCGSDSKVSAHNAGDPGSIPGLGSSPGEGNGNPVQYSFLENSMDRGAWKIQSTGVQRVRHD